jgi:hypothetical protein
VGVDHVFRDAGPRSSFETLGVGATITPFATPSAPISVAGLPL